MKIAQTLRYCSIKSDKVSGGRNPPRGQKNENLGDLVFVCVIRVLRVMQGSARSVRSLSWLKCDLITSELLQLVSWPHPLKKDQPFFFFFFTQRNPGREPWLYVQSAERRGALLAATENSKRNWWRRTSRASSSIHLVRSQQVTPVNAHSCQPITGFGSYLRKQPNLPPLLQ